MGERYLVDSNVIIDFFANRLPQKASDFVQNNFNNDFLISVAVKIEVSGFNDLPQKIKAVDEFLSSATVLALDEPITEKAIALRRAYKSLKLGDAIIAATAIVYGLTLLTRNISDFQKIDGLKTLNVWEL